MIVTRAGSVRYLAKLACKAQSRKQTINPINLFQPSVTFNIETSHLFCSAKQITGFYMKCNARLKWVKTRN